MIKKRSKEFIDGQSYILFSRSIKSFVVVETNFFLFDKNDDDDHNHRQQKNREKFFFATTIENNNNVIYAALTIKMTTMKFSKEKKMIAMIEQSVSNC